EGFEAHAANLRLRNWRELERSSGVSEADMRTVAQLAGRAERTICCWAMGLTQHKNAVGNIQELVNFLLLRGNFGRPGAGACPVRGHSNVQGDRTMGIHEQPAEPFLSRLGHAFGFVPPRKPGHDV